MTISLENAKRLPSFNGIKMNLDEAVELEKAIHILDKIPQFYEGEELEIGKNDPKNGKPDYWWLTYGSIELSRYYSLTKLLVDFAHTLIEEGVIK